jgi:DNA-binding MarR family transcriptional regulator
MKDIGFFQDFHSALGENAKLHNDRIASPAAIRKKMPYAKAGVSLVQRMLLLIIRSSDRVNIAYAAKLAHCTPRNTSIMAEELCKKGFIEKYRSEENKSKVYLRLTDKGNAVIDANRKMWLNYLNAKASAVLDEQERDDFLSSYRRVNDTLTKAFPVETRRVKGRKYIDKLTHEINRMPQLANSFLVERSEKPTHNFIEHNCLSTIFEEGPVTVTNLAVNNAIPLERASKAVTALVNLGVVERFQKPGDRRTYYVQMTDKGKESFLTDRASGVAYTQTVLSDTLNDGECDRLLKDLKYINELLHRF